MIQSVKTFLLCLTAVGAISAVILALIPDGTGKRILTFACGLVFFLVAIRPFFDLKDFELPTAPSKVQASADYSEIYLHSLADDICRRTEEYILDKAGKSGARLTAAKVEAETEGTYPVPCSVTLEGAYTEAQKRMICQWIAKELNIPVERQSWNYRGESKP